MQGSRYRCCLACGAWCATIDAPHQGLDLDGLDNGSGGVFGGSAAWGGWGSAGAGRSASAVSGANVAFPGLDPHGLGTAALGAWSVNSQGVRGEHAACA